MRLDEPEGGGARVSNRGPRRSTLVSENATIDVSWFAARGLMSRRSFERYQKEMKRNVIEASAASSSSNLRSLGARDGSSGSKGRFKRGGNKRASISMGDLRNHEWPGLAKQDEGGAGAPAVADEASVTASKISRRKSRRHAGPPIAHVTTAATLSDSRKESKAGGGISSTPKNAALDSAAEGWAGLAGRATPPSMISVERAPGARKPRSVDQGLDQLARDKPGTKDRKNKNRRSTNAAALEGQDLDQLIKSLVTAFKEDRGGSGAAAVLAPDRAGARTPSSQDLNSDEIEVLAKMVRRLTQDQDQGPPKRGDDHEEDDNEDESSLQVDDDESTLQGPPLMRGVKRDCSNNDLMDSSTWEGNGPLAQSDSTETVELSASRDDVTEEQDFSLRQRMPSVRSMDTVKAGRGRGGSPPPEAEIEVERSDKKKSAATASGRTLADKYVPKRSSSVELAGGAGRRPLVREVDFSSSVESNKFGDSFHTSMFERSETLSSNMISVPGDEDGEEDEEDVNDGGEYDNESSIFDYSTSPKKKERSDTISTLSLSSPFVANGKVQPKQAEKEALIESAKGLAMPSFDRGVSAASATTQGAVSPELTHEDKLARGDSIGTDVALPGDGQRGSREACPPVTGLPRRSQFSRRDTSGTDCAVAASVCMWDEIDRLHKQEDNEESLRVSIEPLKDNESCGHQRTASGASDRSPAKNGSGQSLRPPRRHSISSSSSSVGGEGWNGVRRNSFSSFSLYTAPMDIDDLDGPALKEGCGDILEEGMEYLSMSMLVNVYAKLRELSTLGHASVKLVDIDVNSHQSLARQKEMVRLGLLKKIDKTYLSKNNTRTAGAVVRRVLDEYEMQQGVNDLSVMSQYKRAMMDYDASLLSEFKTWVEESKVKQLDSVTEEVIRKLREECTRRQLIVKERSANRSNDSLSTMEQASVGQSIARRRGSLIEKSDSFQGSSWLKQERTLIADHFGVKSGTPASAEDHRKLSGGALTESLIKKTLDSPNDYFQEGSALRNLLESGLEVVWFSDRHPNDVIYCICVNRETVTVTVVFRGQEGLSDLLKDSRQSSYPNPLLHEDYEGHAACINLRSAVSDEMMRVRRDTKKSTLDEIRDKVCQIGKELTGGGRYHLSVAGHSLGGGLATVAGFYLASDPSLELASAVRVFSFASSRVGCMAFRQGFKHLEETGRLQHARFTNSNGIRSLLPLGAAYHHVGMQINLHKANSAGRQRTRQSLDVSWNKSSSGIRLGDICHLLMNFLSITRSSRISEYQHRMHFAREYRLALGDGVLRFDKRRNRLKSLNDYYLMKCRFSDVMGKKEQAAMPSFLVFFLVSCLISFEVALLFKFASAW